MSETPIDELVYRCTAKPAGPGQGSDPRTRAGWEEFVLRYGGKLKASVYRALRRARLPASSWETEELAQEVYLRLLAGPERGLARFRGASEGEIGSYLGRVARNAVADRARREGAFKRRGPLPTQPSSSVEPDTKLLADLGASPEDRLLLKEWWRSIQELFHSAAGARSPERDLEILRLSVEGWSSREIVDSVEGLGSASSVDSVLSRMRSRLAERGVVLPVC